MRKLPEPPRVLSLVLSILLALLGFLFVLLFETRLVSKVIILLP